MVLRRTGNHSLHGLFAGVVITLSALFFSTESIAASFADDDRARVESGETQVLAKIGRREITISELRIEMNRLGLTEGTPETQRFALQSIVNRHLLVNAARNANFHRKPDAVLQMKAAENQALADYFLAAASQAAEPTLAEIEDYIAGNPGLFAKRKKYEFAVLSMPGEYFVEDALTPFFSETHDFANLRVQLDQQKVPYSEKPLVQASSSFPREIRDQLALYSVNDNIVIKSQDEAQIMKIRSVKEAPVPVADWRAIARRLVLEQNAVNRARSLLDSLKVGNSVIYYRPELAPTSVVQEKKRTIPAKPTKTLPGTKPKTTGK